MAPKPYDKHPEWETLTAHSAAVRHCCIGSRESGHPLIATASDDSSVQLWDTRNMPSPKVVKLPVSKFNNESVRSVFLKQPYPFKIVVLRFKNCACMAYGPFPCRRFLLLPYVHIPVPHRTT